MTKKRSIRENELRTFVKAISLSVVALLAIVVLRGQTYPTVQGASLITNIVSNQFATDYTVIWPANFADNNYSAACSIEDYSGLSVLGVQVQAVRSYSTNSIHVLVRSTQAPTRDITIHCVGVHN